MCVTKKHFYYPYLETDLVLLSNENIFHGNHSLFLVSDIDLYFQPVEETFKGIIYLIIGLFITIVGEIIQFKLLKMVKHENGLVKEVTQFFCISSIIMYPILFLITSATDFLHSLDELFIKWFCPTIWVMHFIFLNIFTSHSFFVAIMRYFFIIHEEKVEKYGKQKIKRIFFSLYLLLPSMMVIFSVIERPEWDPFLYINTCYGRDHILFLKDIEPLDVLNPYFCGSDDIKNDGMIENGIAIIKKILCISKLALSVLMGFNISEGLIYWRIFKHMKR